MKQFKRSLLALLLCTALLLTGCGIMTFSDRLEQLESMLESAPTEVPTEHRPHKPTEDPKPQEKPTDTATEPTDPTEEGAQDLHTYVPYEEFEREYEPYLDQVPFSQIQYTAPDSEPIIKGYEAVQAMVEEGKASAKEIVDAFEAVFEDHLFFDTMHSYAYIRYSLDLSDTYYDEEYNRCEELSPLISQAQEKCYVAMCSSPHREALEEDYFGEDFFLFYDENRIYSKDSVVKLMQQESDIQAQYLALQNDPTVFWKGKETSFDTLIEDPNLPYEDYLTVYEAYYSKYTPLAADLYAQLIRTRKAIAAELEYESYADFAHSYLYSRDYGQAQVDAYCNDIADELPSLLFTAVMTQGNLPEKAMPRCLDIFRNTIDSFGGVIKTAYEFMKDYELWDTTSSPSKLPGSYMTYLNSYEMPFLYVSPAGNLGDVSTLFHEFGHFVDGFVNCGGFSSIDCAEVFSQSMEFLSLSRADLDPAERSALVRSKAADSVMVFLTQACYAEFENLAYSLPEDKLNAKGLNDLFLECNRKYGISMLYMGMENFLSPGWIDVQHFFIAPYYVISYCVSNDTALQVYERELAEGDGLDLFYELLQQDRDSTLPELTEGAGLASPFAKGRFKTLADFLDDQLN